MNLTYENDFPLYLYINGCMLLRLLLQIHIYIMNKLQRDNIESFTSNSKIEIDHRLPYKNKLLEI